MGTRIKRSKNGQFAGSYARPAAPPPSPSSHRATRPMSRHTSEVLSPSGDWLANVSDAYHTIVGEKVTIDTGLCVACHQPGSVEVDANAFDAYRSGQSLRDAFPDLQDDVRDQILTGVHGPCRDALLR